VGASRSVRVFVVLIVAAMFALAGCGDDEGGSGSEDTTSAAPPQTTTEAAPKTDSEPKPSGTTITVRESEFGPMLFDSKKQAIYIFENDPKNKTVCYDECAEAWPPVFTEGEPRADGGAKQSLLGTVERRDGKLQVTYAGKPLYFYAHEEPGEVRCHNVDLNGGLWWVVGPDGKRRP
jgi:predicted lipoprotein with Yx(FWY)xxD motif